MLKAKITEIFSSIQGEGPYVGEEQVFVRFSGCNLSCKFCDERKKRDSFLEYTPNEVIEKIINEGRKTVSFTGGEPLLQADFLKDILLVLKEKDLSIYLETNGILKDELLKVLDYVDVISMDIKLPSSTGCVPYWQEHTVFLKEAIKKEVFVKSIVTPETIPRDVEMAVSIVKSLDENIPFIIQPVSYNGNIEKVGLLGDFFDSARGRLNNVRVIPQVHKILGVK
ncbi:MAG: 7-carboxy-7-deazaguanine synthase QueE [Candidatus Omnitrophica bacterium]|nr:7-carboxy-7-deazaguanine synthase QueE [Candidatus Omnitrophota bacterium]